MRENGGAQQHVLGRSILRVRASFNVPRLIMVIVVLVCARYCDGIRLLVCAPDVCFTILANPSIREKEDHFTPLLAHREGWDELDVHNEVSSLSPR